MSPVKNCRHLKTKNTVEVADGYDIRCVVCADPACGFVLSRARAVIDSEGKETLQPMAVPLESQPESFQFKGKDGGFDAAEEPLPSAADMAALAMKTRQETIGKQVRDLAREILEACKEVVLDGVHRHCLPEDVPGKIVVALVKELKDYGYKVSKTPKPGEGVWLTVRWATVVRRKRREKDPAKTVTELDFTPKRSLGKKREILKKEASPSQE